MNHAVPEQFLCFKCGACCLDISDVPKVGKWATSSGACRYYDHNTHLCQIYQDRPEACNVWKTYLKELSDSSVSWDDFVYTNMLNCCLLRYLHGIPEPPGSPFAENQEVIASQVLANLVDPEAILRTVRAAEEADEKSASPDARSTRERSSARPPKREDAYMYRPGEVGVSEVPDLPAHLFQNGRQQKPAGASPGSPRSNAAAGRARARSAGRAQTPEPRRRGELLE